MKNNLQGLICLVLLSTLNPQLSTCFAQGTAFTYQGRLNDGANAANGSYDLTFSVWSAASGPAQVGRTVTNATTGVTNGLFTATLDFGTGVFDGNARWLEIAVRTNGTSGFTPLTPRQGLLATPYALRTASAQAADSLTGVLPSAQLAGTYAQAVTLVNAANSFSGNGAGLTALNAGNLATGTVADARLSGNVALLNSSPAFSGNVTAGDVVAGSRLRIGSGHVLGGALASIAGGANNTNQGSQSFVGGGVGNRIDWGDEQAVIVGGRSNSVRQGVVASAIVGGEQNYASGEYVFIGGGRSNSVLDSYGTIAGGRRNSAGAYAGVSGGSFNAATGVGAFVGGGGNGGLNPTRGANNIASGSGSGVVGGMDNTATGNLAFVGGGSGNLASGYGAVVAGGGDSSGSTNNIAAGSASAVGGGLLNDNEANWAFIGGGYRNTLNTNAVGSVIGGGRENTIQTNAQYAAIPGGYLNTVGGSYAMAAGNRARALHPGAFVWADTLAVSFDSTATNQFSVRANGGARFVTGGAGMTVDGQPVIAGTVPASQLSGIYTEAVVFNNTGNSFAGSGTSLTGLNASALASGTVPDARLAANVARTSQVWLLGGNTGTTVGTHFLGTSDNEPLEIKIYGQRALRLEPAGDGAYDGGAVPDGAPNVIAGSPVNMVGAGVVGATIAGGGATNFWGSPATNAVLADYGAVGGGVANRIEKAAWISTIAGGYLNSVASNAFYSAIGGGNLNTIEASARVSTIAGGAYNGIGLNSFYAAIGGGYDNTIYAGSESAIIGGGYNNNVGLNSDYASILGGWLNDIGTNAAASTVAGGHDNNIEDNAQWATIAGGDKNDISRGSAYATIAGGRDNLIGDNADNSTIGGGQTNTISADATWGTIAGGWLNVMGTNSDYSAIGGGGNNTIADDSTFATVAGGRLNVVQTNTDYSTIAGGFNNTVGASSLFATIPGGNQNYAGGDYSFAAGNRAKANHDGALVWADSAAADFTSDRVNQVKLRAAGGLHLVAQSSGLTPAAMKVESTSSGGVGLFITQTSSDANLVIANPGTGPQIKAFNGPGGGNIVFQVDNDGDVTCKSLAQTSDRNAKENFTAIDSRAVLDRVASMAISEWNFKQDDTRHIGPMAQDFHAAFGLGPDDKHISMVDADGVALAAIQGLNEKVESGKQKAESRIELLEQSLQQKQTEITELQQTVNELKELVTAMNQKLNGGVQ